ncbi:MAG: ATP-binding response regulator [Gemmatimonadaceae bacterium]
MRIPTPEAIPDLLEPGGRRPLLAYVAATFGPVAAAVIRLSLNDVLGAGSPFLFFILAVMAAAWLGGWRPGLLAMVVSAPLGMVLIVQPDVPPWQFGQSEWIAIGSFFTVGVLIAGLSEALHRARERVEARTRDLQLEMRERRAIEENLREMGRRKDEFLAVLAHELRNPLTPIVNAAALLHAREDADPIIGQAAQLIDRHSNHMVHLIDDLLDVARIERGSFELRRAHCDVQRIVEAAVDYCRPAVKEKGHALDVRLPEHPLYVEGDELRLVQLVANLVHNASAYTAPGGHIRVVVTAEQTDLVIRVRDNGDGIAPQRLEHIFQMFARGVRQASASGGLGIGLALVRQITELHGGKVHALSDGEGKGSEFVVRLPGASVGHGPADPAPSELESVTESADMRRLRVLAVDDNPDLLDSLAMVLRLLGHEVEVAATGESALALMESQRPDVVLVDVGMPGMNGYEVAGHARLHSWGAQLTLVAMTGWGRSEDRERALKAGFDRHVVKPLDLERLKSLLASIGPAASVVNLSQSRE